MKDPHYSWLVEARSKNQQLLLRMYEFGTQHAAALRGDALRCWVFTASVGVAFSLWRAAFLADAARTWSKALEDANKLLEILVRDNSVAYPQDRNTREWMGGYYLNNARFRLITAMSRLEKLQPNISELDSFRRVHELHTLGIEERSPAESWEILHQGLCDMFQVLIQSLSDTCDA